MRRYPLFLLVMLALTFSSSDPATARQEEKLDHGRELVGSADSDLGGVMILEDVGQYGAPPSGETPAGRRFRAIGTDEMMWFDQDGFWVTILQTTPPAQVSEPLFNSITEIAAKTSGRKPHQGVHVRLSLSGASPERVLEPFGRLDTPISFFQGQSEARQNNIPAWSGLRYREVYPGIDLVISAGQDGLAFRLETRPGANLEPVRLDVVGAQGVQPGERSLQVNTAAGSFQLPLIQRPGRSVLGQARSTRLEMSGETTFEVSTPFQALEDNPSAQAPARGLPPALSIDELPNLLPQNFLLASTFVGGLDGEGSLSMAVDPFGNILLAGETSSPDFPTRAGGFDGTCGSDGNCNDQLDPEVGWVSYTDAFVVKLDPFGRRLLWATFLGGSANEWGTRLALDRSGDVYLTGSTLSQDFPTTGGGSAGHGPYGNSDVFVTRLSANGSSLKFSTLLGGVNGDYPWDIKVGRAGPVYVTGETYSPDFPVTSGAFDPTCGVDQNCDMAPDAFLFQLSSDGKKLNYSTFIGGSAADYGLSLAVDPVGQAYLAGSTNSPDFPATPKAYDPLCGTDGICDDYVSDGFVAKFTPDGKRLVYGTFVGGSWIDNLTGLAIDSAGAAYVTGETGSSDFPTTPGVISKTPAGGHMDLFVTKIEPSGQELAYSTYLGGTADEWGGGLTVDALGNAYVVGRTYSCDFPTTPDGYDRTRADGVCDSPDGFIYNIDLTLTRLNPKASQLLYGTFLGASGGDWGGSLSFDRFGFLVVSGVTSSPDLPVTPWAYDRTYNGNSDDFVLKMWIHTTSRAEGASLYADPDEPANLTYLPLVK